MDIKRKQVENFILKQIAKIDEEMIKCKVEDSLRLATIRVSYSQILSNYFDAKDETVSSYVKQGKAYFELEAYQQAQNSFYLARSHFALPSSSTIPIDLLIIQCLLNSNCIEEAQEIVQSLSTCFFQSNTLSSHQVQSIPNSFDLPTQQTNQQINHSNTCQSIPLNTFQNTSLNFVENTSLNVNEKYDQNTQNYVQNPLIITNNQNKLHKKEQNINNIKEQHKEQFQLQKSTKQNGMKNQNHQNNKQQTVKIQSYKEQYLRVRLRLNMKVENKKEELLQCACALENEVRTKYGNGSVEVGLMLFEKGEALAQCGRNVEAVQIMRECVEQLITKKWKEAAHVARIYGRLADLQQSLNHHDQAYSCLVCAQAMLRQTQDQRALITISHRIAQNLLLRAHPQQALEILLKVQVLQREAYSECQPKVVATLRSIATLMHQLGRSHQAKIYQQQYLRVATTKEQSRVIFFKQPLTTSTNKQSSTILLKNEIPGLKNNSLKVSSKNSSALIKKQSSLIYDKLSSDKPRTKERFQLKTTLNAIRKMDEQNDYKFY